MVSQATIIASALVVMACIGTLIIHFENILVPANLSTYDSRLIRVIAVGVEINAIIRTLPFNSHLHLTNFVWTVFTVFIEANLSNESSLVRYTDMQVDGDVLVRLYEPVKEVNSTRPGIIFLHGGGMMYGDTETYHFLTQHLAIELDAVLISVDFRHSWESPFPAAVEESTQAAVWFLHHTHQYNVDPDRIAIAGDSAGGCIAAAIAQRLTFNKTFAHLPTLKFQALIYPGLQAFDFLMPSFQQHGAKPSAIATHEFITFCYSYYMIGNPGLQKAFDFNMHTSAEAKRIYGKLLSHDMIPEKFKQNGYTPPQNDSYGNTEIYQEIEKILLDPDACPLLREYLQGLPPTYIVTVEQDPLRDDGIIYGHRLKEAGVQVTWKHYEKGIHGMFQLFIDPFSIEAGKQSVQDLIDFGNYQFYG